MKKLIIVDEPTFRPDIFYWNLEAFFEREEVEYTELPITPAEINYLLTLHKMNEDGIHYAPVPEDIENKLRLMI